MHELKKKNPNPDCKKTSRKVHAQFVITYKHTSRGKRRKKGKNETFNHASWLTNNTAALMLITSTN